MDESIGQSLRGSRNLVWLVECRLLVIHSEMHLGHAGVHRSFQESGWGISKWYEQLVLEIVFGFTFVRWFGPCTIVQSRFSNGTSQQLLDEQNVRRLRHLVADPHE